MGEYWEVLLSDERVVAKTLLQHLLFSGKVVLHVRDPLEAGLWKLLWSLSGNHDLG
jgi:hypothetical protein